MGIISLLTCNGSCRYIVIKYAIKTTATCTVIPIRRPMNCCKRNLKTKHNAINVKALDSHISMQLRKFTVLPYITLNFAQSVMKKMFEFLPLSIVILTTNQSEIDVTKDIAILITRILLSKLFQSFCVRGLVNLKLFKVW